jgi:hypothetical protein
MSQLQVNRINDASGGVLAPISSVMRNRIINGAMTISQRNGTSSITPTTDGEYTLDRWGASLTQASKFSVQQDAGAVTPPVGFVDYLGATSLSAYSVLTNDYFLLQQKIEGFNVSDLGWGTASAKTVTLSFWARSSLTGTFGGSLSNSAINRSYPFTYTISSANTWEYKTITIAGDTSGTWLTTNGIGLRVILSLGAGSGQSGTAGAWAGSQFLSATGATSVVGTNGATFYITGVQLEVGTQATSFEYRQYTTELQLCQRYYWKLKGSDGNYASFSSGLSTGSTTARHSLIYPTTMRAAPTFSFGGIIAVYDGGTGVATSLSALAGLTCSLIDYTSSSGGLSTGRGCVAYPSTTAADFIQASAEL